MSITLTYRGKRTDEQGNEKSVTLMTISGIDDFRATQVQNNAGTLAKAVQKVTSATMTSYTIAMSEEYQGASDTTVTPANPLDSNEIFNAAYSDIEVVPTLQINTTDGTTTKNYSIKYMGDPEETSDFEEKIASVTDALRTITGRSATTANLTFTAKDEIYQES